VKDLGSEVRYAQNSAKFVLSCLPQDNLVIKKGNFPGLYTGRGIPKTIFDCGGQGSRIISVIKGGAKGREFEGR
jgi:hypothetical protein